MAKRHDSKLASAQRQWFIGEIASILDPANPENALDTIGFLVRGAAPHAFADDDRRDYDDVDSRLQ
jgi:hypothetical protein